MIKTIANYIFVSVFAVLILFSAYLPSGEAAEQIDFYSGYYSRDGNDDRPARISGNSIYLKFYREDQRVIMLYVPYPYSLTLNPDVLHKAFKDVAGHNGTKAYVRDKFGGLAEQAVAHIETFEILEQNQIRFECDGTAPCRVAFSDQYIEMRKAGMLNDHIIKFNRID